MEDQKPVATTVYRTADVLSTQATSFCDLCIPRRILLALSRSGYSRPSPIQEKAIPLARLGVDVMIQAKAGTGKTLVFAVAAGERVDAQDARPQALLIAPTREIALQASDTVRDIASSCGVSVLACIGGLPTSEDERLLRKGCHVVVGTPGRLLSLIERGSLTLESLKMIVLDEADRLMEDLFFDSIMKIFSNIKSSPQILALSATFQDKTLVKRLEVLTGDTLSNRSFFHVYIEDDVRDDGIVSTSLLGVVHYYFDVSGAPELKEYIQQLKHIFERVSFRQCIVFCPTKAECLELTKQLLQYSYAAGYLSSEIGQLDRIHVLNDLRQYKTRILVCTDVAARGIDLPNVDLVCNVGALPHDASTLAHRIGRAGRFGTRGVAVTVVTQGKDLETLRDMVLTSRGSDVKSFESHDTEDTSLNIGASVEENSSTTNVHVSHLLPTKIANQAQQDATEIQHNEPSFQAQLDIIMNASLWKITDDILRGYNRAANQGATRSSHIDLVLQSVSNDVAATSHKADTTERDSLELLSEAFSKLLCEQSPNQDGMLTWARHTRSLGSVQANAAMEERNNDSLFGGPASRGPSTLAHEADILERMWDEAMLEERQMPVP